MSTKLIERSFVKFQDIFRVSNFRQAWTVLCLLNACVSRVFRAIMPVCSLLFKHTLISRRIDSSERVSQLGPLVTLPYPIDTGLDRVKGHAFAVSNHGT